MDAQLMHYYPGQIVNEWTMNQYFGYLNRIVDVEETFNGSSDHRSKVERMARRRHED